MSEKKPEKGKPKKVLADYKKIGTTFVPPIIHRVGPMEYTSWSSQTLPELIWWDAIIDHASLRLATRIAEEIAKHLKPSDPRERWFGFISDYSHLSAEDMSGLKEHLKRENLLTDLTKSLADFVNLYPSCPLARFFDDSPTGVVDTDYLQHLVDRMRELEDKRSRNGVLIQAQPIYMGFVLGKLYVKEGLALADFPEVAKYPSTELSQHVGASICAAVNMLAGTMLPKFSEDAWVQYFWQRSLELCPLDFSHLETR